MGLHGRVRVRQHVPVLRLALVLDVKDVFAVSWHSLLDQRRIRFPLLLVAFRTHDQLEVRVGRRNLVRVLKVAVTGTFQRGCVGRQADLERVRVQAAQTLADSRGLLVATRVVKRLRVLV